LLTLAAPMPGLAPGAQKSSSVATAFTMGTTVPCSPTTAHGCGKNKRNSSMQRSARLWHVAALKASRVSGEEALCRHIFTVTDKFSGLLQAEEVATVGSWPGLSSTPPFCHTSTHMHTSMNVCVHIRMYTCTHAYACQCSQTHTHTNTRKQMCTCMTCVCAKHHTHMCTQDTAHTCTCERHAHSCVCTMHIPTSLPRTHTWVHTKM
jgi:hypothetical protein